METMETKDAVDSQVTEDVNEVTDTNDVRESKDTKDRLDKLKELYAGGYVTEDEFKVARVNILKEGGLDVVIRQSPRLPCLEEDDEEQKNVGCGCFLAAFLLAAFIVLSVSFLAAPYWPNRFGGAGARAAREWFTAKGASFIDGLFAGASDSAQVPDPVSSDNERPTAVSPGITTPASETAKSSPDVTAEAPVAGGFALPSILNITPLEPDISVMEMSAPVPQRAENARRGYISVTRARIRSSPDTSTNRNVLGWGRSGERFAVLEEGTGRDGAKWYRVRSESGDTTGWVSGALLRMEN